MLRPDGARAIQADRLRVGGSVPMRRLSSTGEIRMHGAEVRGSLDMIGVQIESAGIALDLSDMRIGASVYLVEEAADSFPRVSGTLVLSRTHIAGALLIRNATLTEPTAEPRSRYYSLFRQSHAINASRLSVGALMTIEGETVVRGSIHLASAELGGFSMYHPAALDAGGRTALNLINAELRASVRMLGGVEVRGTMRLDGARIRGWLELVGARLSEPEGTTLLSADGVVVDGDVDLHHLTAIGGQLKFWRATLEAVWTLPELGWSTRAARRCGCTRPRSRGRCAWWTGSHPSDTSCSTAPSSRAGSTAPTLRSTVDKRAR
jgi:hypothetical protein